ncbi:hypothetical protein, conserved [Plasmodium gonderi]|uniref:Protein LTV1 homolog n=1 Tax=Plasmodium gonderi TaxID=77519 RepID=A0A1Y1JDQ7_PLAGO|nr:hypothetical protein, conserved [Plasmodium gonderi]GAW79465.1 hypothetical protein, conserved [Plasmodium gonderi]
MKGGEATGVEEAGGEPVGEAAPAPALEPALAGAAGERRRKGKGGCQVKKVTFRDPLVVGEIRENEKHEFNETFCGEEEYTKDLDEGELSVLMRSFNPLDFGIKEKLSESEKKILIREIFGGKNNNFAPPSCVTKTNKEKKCIIILEDVQLKDPKESHDDEMDRSIKKQGENKYDNHVKDIKNDSIKKPKRKKKKKNNKKETKKNGKREKGDDDPLAYLDGDCYFPNDGYDYEQHLKTISQNFVEIKPNSENKFFEVKPTSEEERELFKTFDSENYEELNDNFVFEAQDVSTIDNLDVSEEIIWGDSNSFLPFSGIRSDVNTGHMIINSEHLTELGEIEDGDMSTGASISVEGTDEGADEGATLSQSNRKYSDRCDPHNAVEKINGRVIFDEGANLRNHTSENINLDVLKKGDNDLNALKLSDLVELEMEKVKSRNLNEIKNLVTKKKRKKKQQNCRGNDTNNVFVNVHPEDKNKILQILNLQKEEENEMHCINSFSGDPGELSSIASTASSFSYDCETILTTKTNTTNHPYKLIIPKKITTSSCPPKMNNILSSTNTCKRKENEKNAESIKLENYLVLEKINVTRAKNETPEEKRDRKKSVKEAQRLNRKLKKENLLLMKNEKKMMNKKMNPFDIRDNVKYIKL